jgi:uncharacterized protein
VSALELSPVRYSALCLTHNCNLRCKYCYAGPKTRSSMSFDTGRRAMDFLAAASNGSCTITFFGGEPLMEFELIQQLVEYGERRHGRKLQYRMSTNGTLLRRSTIDYCREHDLYFVLSLDGNADQHDTNRRFAGGAGSYDSIVGCLDDVFDFNPYTMAVSVVTPETAGLVASGVKDLFRRGFRYVLQTLDYSAPWEKRQIKILKKQYVDLARYYSDALRDGKKLYYSPFDERIKTWAQKPYGKGDLCDLANTQIAVSPSGRIYPCVQFIGEDGDGNKAHAIGEVFGGFDETRRRYFVQENYADKVSCAACALAGRCATFCGCVNWRATGDLKTVPPIICEHERMLMPITDRMATRLWKRNVTLFKRKFYEKTFPVSSYIEDCLLKRKG